MCYVANVFHPRCGHWSNTPHIIHVCPCARFVQRPSYSTRNLNPLLRRYETVPYSCHNKQSRGSGVDHERTCDQCIAREGARRIVEKQKGMWLSVCATQDGKWLEMDSKPELTRRMLERAECARRLSRPQIRDDREIERRLRKTSDDGFCARRFDF